MKKLYSYFICLFVALSTFLFSCGGGKKSEDANRCKITVTTTEGGKVKITEYLATTECVPIDSRIEVVATPDDGFIFTGWYLGDSTGPISNDAVFTFIATKNSTLTAHFAKDHIINGHEYVDLGLSSGLKWAICNVGASSPEDYGGYYAWGEIEEKENYSWNTYKWCNGSYKTMTKYYIDSDYGIVDNKTVLDPDDDVAHVKWGGTWRMPTFEEIEELFNKCTWTWTTQSGVNGHKVTGPNGNSIFLPAAGCRYRTEAHNRGSSGYYWSSSLYGNYSYNAYNFHFSGGYYLCHYGYRYGGRSVRPVCD